MIQLFPDLLEIQRANILRSAVHQNLTQQPAFLKWIVEVESVRAPNDVTGKLCGHE